MLKYLVAAIFVAASAVCAPIELSANASGGGGVFVTKYGTPGETEFTFGRTLTGNLTVEGTVRASFQKGSVSLVLTDAVFSCPNGCTPGYAFRAALALPFEALPTGPLQVTAHVAGTANVDFIALVDIETFVGTLDEFTEIRGPFGITSGAIDLTVPSYKVVLPDYAPDTPAFLAIAFFGSPGSFFQGELTLPDSMSITVTSVPEPATMLLSGLGLTLAAIMRRRAAR